MHADRSEPKRRRQNGREPRALQLNRTQPVHEPRLGSLLRVMIAVLHQDRASMPHDLAARNRNRSRAVASVMCGPGH
jgi:hypothetical protein